MLRLLLPLSLLALPFCALAQQPCPASIRAALLPAGGADVVAEACKTMPGNASQWLATLAYRLEPLHEDFGRVQHVLAVVDAKAGLQARFEQELQEDVTFELFERSFAIDTARYHLAPGQRAFGVKIRSGIRGPSCPDYIYGDELTLYVQQGAALKPVFSTHLAAILRLEGEFCGGAEPLVADEATIILSMGGGRSHGFRDIISTATVTRTWENDSQPSTTRRVSHVYRYDGSRYDSGQTAFQNALYWHDPEDLPR